jgi:hypothetical protein
MYYNPFKFNNRNLWIREACFCHRLEVNSWIAGVYTVLSLCVLCRHCVLIPTSVRQQACSHFTQIHGDFNDHGMTHGS